VPYVPVGQFQQPTVYRSSLSDVIRIGIPVFWNLRKA
jgi:peptide/nickel transport system substrate-binding protein